MALRIWRTILALAVAAGLAVDAYVHFDLASTYDPIKTSTLSQGDQFRVEAALAVLAGLAVLVRPRWYTSLLAFVVAAGALAAVLVYRSHHIKAFGPIPAMYEPLWYPEKTNSAYAEAGAAVASAALLILTSIHRRPRQVGA